VLKERVLLVATDGDAIVGFGQLNPDAGEVDAVYVLPDRQGQGIGQRLLAGLEAEARARDIRALELSATLNAVSFYAQAGYTRRHVAVHRLPTGVELECVRMGKEL
jgi:GNAT superfamily N-acetyltransferase